MMLSQYIANRIPDHHSYKSCRKHSHCLGLPPPGPLRRSCQALLHGVSLRCHTYVLPIIIPLVSMQKTRSHLPNAATLCFSLDFDPPLQTGHERLPRAPRLSLRFLPSATADMFVIQLRHVHAWGQLIWNANNLICIRCVAPC